MPLSTFKHLLSNSIAWNLTTDKRMREFFSGLTGIEADFKKYDDDIWLDIFPGTTRDLLAWEQQFGLANNVVNEADRRSRLLANWRALGGQSPHYIQTTLQAAGFDVYVHEWWDPASLPSTCPTPRNPNIYINDGTNNNPLLVDGGDTAVDGHEDSVDGGTLLPKGFLLVNKLLELAPNAGNFADGDVCAQDGSFEAQDGGEFQVYTEKQYEIPTDPDKWHYFLYIGGETFPNQAQVPITRRDEFETLCLKICPAQQWLGMLIDYV
jgi:hypothetical protein